LPESPGRGIAVRRREPVSLGVDRVVGHLPKVKPMVQVRAFSAEMRFHAYGVPQHRERR